jgi:predicted ATPase/DNA-binding winged helix-turn-helix (wHTH) protein
VPGLLFGPIEVQPQQRRLIVEGRDVPVGARAFDVLVALAERAGSLVSKNDLLELAWPGVVVEENNLQVQVSTLRKVLGPQAIATIPGRGYRFTLTHDAADSTPSERRPSRRGGSAPASSVGSAPVIDDLYGRDHDIVCVADLVKRHKLVTVVGPAGIGKTRLAHAVVERVRDEFAEHARIIELAPMGDAALVSVSIAACLGIPVRDQTSARRLIVQALADQQMLLVLDNCEHLLDEVDHLVAALRTGAPGVHILATSQEVLRHADEHRYRLEPLAVPEEATVAAARRAGAVELFMARAQAVDPRMLLTETNVGAVVEICRRLDGIPLALELAAARLPLLGLDGVRARLNQRFLLLTAGSRVALRRHQTLRAALEWSCGLLADDEQAVFAKLGVFAGSFSLEAAQRLAAGDGRDEWSVLDHLSALVDKSLVVVESGEPPRYRMLETTRAFALERLAQSGGTQETMRRHAQVMLDVFEDFHREHVMHCPASTAERLSPDHDNLRTALRWACGQDGDPGIAVALLGAAGSPSGYLRHVALRAEAWSMCESVRPLAGGATSDAQAARFWLACTLHGSDNAPSVAIEDGHRAVALYRRLGDRVGLYLACSYLAFALLQTGRTADANARLSEALELRDPSWRESLRMRVDNVAVLIYLESERIEDARTHAIDYLAFARRIGDIREERTAASLVVDVELLAGNVDRAVAEAAEALSMRPPDADRNSPSNRSSDGLNLRIFATAFVLAGRLDEADSIYREALARARRSFGTSAFVLFDAATLLARRGDLDTAARVRSYAEQAYERSGRRPRRMARELDERLCAMLVAQRSSEVLDRLYEEGRAWTDEEACASAFPSIARKVATPDPASNGSPGG